MDEERVREIYESLSEKERIEIVRKLSHTKDEKTAFLLRDLLSKEKEKKVRKEIKRLLFILRTVGIKVEEERNVENPIFNISERKDKYRGFLSIYDVKLKRMVGISAQIRKDLFFILLGIDSFGEGLEKIFHPILPKKEFDKLQEEWKKNIKFQEISPSYAIFLLKEGSRNSGMYKKEIEKITDFLSLKDEIKNPQDLYRLHKKGISKVNTQRIMENKIFDSFILPWEGIDEDSKAFKEIMDPLIILPPYLMEERKRTFLEGLLKKENVRTKLPFLKRMLEDYAYLLYSMQDMEGFEALMEVLENQDLYEIFILYLLEKTLLSKKETEERNCDIINPYKMHEAIFTKRDLF